MFPNMGFVNPQLSNPYNINVNSRPPVFILPNFNPLQQNAQMGTSLLSSFPALPQQFPPISGQNRGFSGFLGIGQVGQNMNLGQGNSGQVFGQFGGWQNQVQVQNVNQLGNMMLNPAQVVALSQLIGCANQVMVPQNAGFIGNPQHGLVQANGMQQPGNFGQQLPSVSQQLQNVPLNAGFAQRQLDQSRTHNYSRANHDNKQGRDALKFGNHPSKNYVENVNKLNRRSQKSQGHPMHNEGKNKPSKVNKGSTIGTAGPDNSANQLKMGNQRSLYSKKEIQKWREERKRNFPTKFNVQKKMTQNQVNKDAADEEAKLRRKQLKEVLAKQVELGCEIAEIPADFLSDSEKLHGRNKIKRQLKNGRPMKRFNKRGNHEQYDKRRKFDCNDSSKGPGMREATLLEKVLSTDMKQDRRCLLQALRFMVMNSFFKDFSEKPLKFPKVITEESGNEELMKELDCCKDAHDASVDCDEKADACQEEGEIAE